MKCMLAAIIDFNPMVFRPFLFYHILIKFTIYLVKNRLSNFVNEVPENACHFWGIKKWVSHLLSGRWNVTQNCLTTPFGVRQLKARFLEAFSDCKSHFESIPYPASYKFS